jgi:D-glycero-D-manno-heptose 1,7-bisphosphate phosphatase
VDLNPRKVVFLDRDGVINRDSADYIKSWAEFEFLPGSLEALKHLAEAGYATVLVSNQSAVARGMLTREALEDIFRRMAKAVAAAGGRINDIFYCPHLPGTGCECRKPKPGMIAAARDRHGIDLEAAVLVGDSTKDILCARHAGVGRSVLVRTGNGPAAEMELADLKITPDHIADDLLAAVRWLMNPPA